MPDTWLGRYSRYVEKLFNVKGGPSLVDLSASITPVLQMNTPPFEERYLVGLESFAAADQQPAVAGNKSAFMLRNPLGSGVIIVVEKITITAGTQEFIEVLVAGSNPADLATAIANHSRADPRSRSVGSGITSRDAPAVDPNTGFLQIAQTVGLANAPFDVILFPNQEIVLLPQIALRVVGQLINTTLTVTFFWRERPLESSELN